MDPLRVCGVIGWLLNLCVVTHNLCVSTVDFAVRLSDLTSTPVKLVMELMFYVPSCPLKDGFTLGTLCNGTTRMNLVRSVMGTTSTLLGPVPAEVTPVISPPVVTLME